MTTRTTGGLIALAVLALGGAAWWLARAAHAPAAEPVATERKPAAPAAAPPRVASRVRAPVEGDEATSGVIDGVVVDAVSHDGVASAELTFLGDSGASTFRTGSDGSFQLTPAGPEPLVLAAISAPGYLPYAPEPRGVRVTLVRGHAAHGVTLTLVPAVDYDGLVVDAHGAPVAGARVRWLARPGTEPVLDRELGAWTTGRDGHFTFQAAEDAVLEASHGNLRGWAQVDRTVPVRKRLTIALAHATARDATITGHVRDTRGAPIAEALVSASQPAFGRGMLSVFATTGADGAFTLAGVDGTAYEVVAEAADHVSGQRSNVLGGSRNVELRLDPGLPLAGQVVDAHGAPVPQVSLLVRRRAGAARPVVATRSIIDPQGRFAVRVPRGDYELFASLHGAPRGVPTLAPAGATDVRIVLGGSATVRGRVVSSADHAPIAGATVGCEATDGDTDRFGRWRPTTAEPTTVTRADGSFELAGIATGPLALVITADGHYTRVEAAGTARDGALLGPLTIELTRTDPEDPRGTEMVGIGVSLSPDGDALRVMGVRSNSGAFEAGVYFLDRMVEIDGLPVASLGVDGAVARLRGVAGTTVTLTLRRDGRDVQVVVERRLLRG